MTTVKNIYDYLNSKIDFSSQEPWDNSGFIIGDFRKEVKKVVVTLDVTKNVAEFAKDIDADLILSHHPVIFGGIDSVKSNSVCYNLIKNDIAVISCHTCLDKANGGINDTLCDILGVKNTYKMPDGFVTIGEIDDEMSIDDFAQFVSNTLSCHGLRYTDTENMIKKVALCSGAGDNDFIKESMSEADVYLTGDMKYHEMLDASEMGFPVISAGHYETENMCAKRFFLTLKEIFTDVEFVESNQANPIMVV